jgi:CRISPR-associated protein Cmr1
MGSKEWRLKALTDIWTGDINGRNSRLIPTGIVGSLRWWYEVLVRGLE